MDASKVLDGMVEIWSNVLVSAIVSCRTISSQLTNEKKKHRGCLGDLLGDEILPGYVGIIINYFQRIPIKQPG